MKNTILLSHGTGGKYTYDFINEFILKNFSNNILDELLDSAVININDIKLAFTTDSYTINPIFFKEADIGKLSVCGTINDLLSVGAQPKFISLSLVIEEGLPKETIQKILHSISQTVQQEDVLIVTGDTKVVEKGSVDKIFITTSGIGIIDKDIELNFSKIEPSDKIIITGTIAEHGLAVLLSRGSYGFNYDIKSDCAALTSLILPILKNKKFSKHIKFMRDPTRGGVASVLNEIVLKRKDIGILLYEENIPLLKQTKNVCELLGLDPLEIANEGKMVIVVSNEIAQDLLEEIKKHPLGEAASIIGEVVSENLGIVALKTIYGTKRIVEMPKADQLPRIC